jgi:hypothetical protein
MLFDLLNEVDNVWKWTQTGSLASERLLDGTPYPNSR